MFTYFYNETIRRSVSVFGTMFNNITVKQTKSDGTVVNSIKVPLSYGQRQKFLQRLKEEPDLNDNLRSAISLPRMGFEISGFTYDQNRQQNKLIRSTKTTMETDNVSRKFQYQPTPYDINFTLSIYAKNMTDGLQIVEQILPYFQPEYTVAMKMIDDMSEVRDVPIILTGVNMDDQFEGSFEDKRVINFTLDFTMKTYFFGPVYTGKVITKVREKTFINDGRHGFTSSELTTSGIVKDVKFYEPAFEGTVASAVSNNTTVTFTTAIDSNVSVNDTMEGSSTNPDPTVSSIAEDRLSVVVSSNVTLSQGDKVYFTGSASAEDNYVISEDVSFFDEGYGGNDASTTD